MPNYRVYKVRYSAASSDASLDISLTPIAGEPVTAPPVPSPVLDAIEAWLKVQRATQNQGVADNTESDYTELAEIKLVPHAAGVATYAGSDKLKLIMCSDGAVRWSA